MKHHHEINTGTLEWYVWLAQARERSRYSSQSKPLKCDVCDKTLLINCENVIFCENGCLIKECYEQFK